MSKLDNICAYTHNTLKLYCELFNNDYSKLYYKDAPLWQIESTQQLVTEVLSGKGLSAEARHNLWVDDLKAKGVTYGKEKTFFNEKLLTHPLLIPYNYLNDFEKSKDNLVNFLVIEFDNFIKNKTKNCFEFYFNYKMTNSDSTLFLKSNKCLLKDCLEDLNSSFNNSISIYSYKILAINNNKLEKILDVKRCK